MRKRSLVGCLLMVAMIFVLMMPIGVLAADSEELSPKSTINNKEYVFSSDYAARINYGATTENERLDKNHFIIQNSAMLEKVVDPTAAAAGKVHWRATFNRDRFNNYGTEHEFLDSASAHSSNPYFNITLSKGLKFANNQVGVTTYWRDTDNKIVSTQSQIVQMPANTGDPNTELLKNFKHPTDKEQYLKDLWYYNEPNDYVSPLEAIGSVYDGSSMFKSLAEYLRCSVRSEFDPSNEGPRPRMGGFSWAKSMGDFKDLDNKKLFNDTYAGLSTNSNKASTALSIAYHTPGTSTTARQKNATVVVDFLTEFDPTYTGDAANKENFVMAHYKSYDDNSDFNRGDIIKFAPVELAAPTAEKWNVKVDEAAKDAAKVIPTHRLVIGTNGAGTFQNEVKNTTGVANLTKNYTISSPVAAVRDVDPVYVGIADVDGKVISFADNVGDPAKPRTGTYGGYDFSVKQASPYNYDGRQSHWSVEWTKRADHGTEFYPDVVSRVRIINPPTKTEYKVGEPFVADGMMVELTDEGGNKLIVTPDEFEKYKLKMDPADRSTLGKEGKDQPVTVTYTPKPEVKDTTPINVAAGDDAGKYTPEVKQVDTKKGEVPDPASQITNKHGDPVVDGKTNLPDGTKFVYTDKDGNPTQPDVSKGGDVSTFIKVTYPDESFEIVPATIHVNTDAEQWRKENTDKDGNFTGKGTTTVEQGNPVDPAKVTVTPELPSGAKVTEVGTVDTATPTEKDKPRTTSGTVVFADESKITDLPVEVTVTPKAATGDPVIVVEDSNTAVPEGYVRLTFDAKEGNFGNDANGQPITKKYLDVKKGLTGKDLKESGKLPANPAATGKTFKAWDPVLPGDTDKITEAKIYGATYDVATPGKPVIVVDNPEGTPVPDGYVRMTFDAADGKFADGSKKVTLDVQKDITGKDLKSDPNFPKNPTLDGKEFDKWTPELPADDAKIDDNTAKDYTATYKAAATELKEPKVDTPKSGDKVVKVGVPDDADTVVVTLPDGKKITVKKDDKGNWTTDDGKPVPVNDGKLEIPTDKPLKADDKVTVQNEKDGNKSPEKTVTVAPSNADTYEPLVKKTETPKDKLPDASELITNKHGDPAVEGKTNLPDGATFEYVDENGNPTKPDVSTAGDKPVKIKVTYPDGSSEIVDGTITVTEPSTTSTEADKYKKEHPDGKGTITVKKNETPDPSKVTVIPALPDGAKVIEIAKVDTSKATEDGKPLKTTGTVVFKDESKIESFPIEVTVSKNDADNHTPVVDNKAIEEGQPAPKPEEMIKNKPDLPTGTTYEYVETPDVSTPGEHPVKIKVTYPDGSSEVVDGKITVTKKEDGAPAKPIVETPKAGDKEVKVTTPTDAHTIEVKLANGDKITVTKDDATNKWTTGDSTPVKEENGKLLIPVPELKAGDKVTVTNSENGKSSTPTEVTVESATPTNPPAKPEVETPQPGDEVVKVKVPTDAPTISVTLPNGDVITVKKDGDKWVTGTGVEVPVNNGKLEIPTGKPLQPGDTIKVETNNGKPSEPTTVTVPKGEVPGNGDNSALPSPEVKPIHPGDNNISVGVPLIGDKVEITLPDGSTVTVNRGENNKWTTDGGLEVPMNDGYLVIPVDPTKTVDGGIVTVVVKKGDITSAATKVTIKKQGSLIGGSHYAGYGTSDSATINKIRVVSHYKGSIPKTADSDMSFVVAAASFAVVMVSAGVVAMRRKSL